MMVFPPWLQGGILTSLFKSAGLAGLLAKNKRNKDNTHFVQFLSSNFKKTAFFSQISAR